MLRPHATIPLMVPADPSDAPAAAANPFTGADVLAILRERGWLAAEASREIISKVESHVVLSRYAARGVLRQLALLLLDGAALTSERFKEIVTALKDGMELRGRELFHPIRLALAGRAGEGELDRVLLLLDEAAALSFTVCVKSARESIIEFCSTLE